MGFYGRGGETVEEDEGDLDEPDSIVLVDGDLVSLPAGDAGELVLVQAGALCASTMARGRRAVLGGDAESVGVAMRAAALFFCSVAGRSGQSRTGLGGRFLGGATCRR